MVLVKVFSDSDSDIYKHNLKLLYVTIYMY